MSQLFDLLVGVGVLGVPFLIGACVCSLLDRRDAR